MVWQQGVCFIFAGLQYVQPLKMKILLKYNTPVTKLLSETPSHPLLSAGLMFTLALLPLGGH